MKSIFKKIAFVLALAMVVTMLPAKTASAASSDGPQMYKSLLLYLDSGNGEGTAVRDGNDITGTYQNERYASVWGWRENGYSKVDFTSEDTSVATVNSKGRVTAVKVGTTTITATFTGDDVDTVTKECKVTVKRNATKAGLSAASAKKVTEEGIAVGDEYQLVAVRKAGAQGNEITVTSGRDQITDGVRFESSDPEIFTVGKTKGKITAVKEGTATLRVWAVQSEGRDSATGEYPATTGVKEYTVKIVAKDIVAKQSAYNKFVLTFPDNESAKAAIEETKKSLTDPNAAVSEAEDIVTVFKVLTDSKDARREVFIGGIGYKDGVEGKTVEVQMFNELDEQSTYVICYKGQEMLLNTPKYIAKALQFGGYKVETAEDYSVQGIWANICTEDGIVLGTNDGSCKNYLNWQDSLVIEDTNTVPVHNEYQFDAAARRVWFYTADRSYKVNLKATFEDWANVTAGSQANVITAYATISPNDNNLYVNSFIDWCVVDGTVGRWDANWSNKTFASEDEGFHLLVKANITEVGKNAEDLYSDSYTAADNFTFVSSNDDKLSVNQETGQLYPPKTPINGTVGIHVYYKGVYVGTCQVQIISKRTFATFSAGGNLSKMSFHQTNTDVNDTITITLYPKDQLNANFNNSFMTYDVEVSENSLKQYFSNNGSATYIGDTWDGYPQYSLSVAPGVTLPENIVNVRVKCIAVYAPQDGSREITKQYPVSFSLKDTTNSTATSYKLFLDKTSVDMTLDNNKTVASKQISICAYGYDKNGYKVEKLVLNGNGYNITVKYGSVAVDPANISYSADNKTMYFDPVIVNTTKKLPTVSGGAIVVDTRIDKVIEKVDTGNYVVALYDNWWRNGKDLQNSALLSITDSQTRPTMTWVGDTTNAATVLSAIHSAIKVTYPNGWTNVTNAVYYGYYDAGGNLVTSDDYKVIGLNGQTISIDKVRYAVKFADGWYEFEVPVKRTIVYGTNTIH